MRLVTRAYLSLGSNLEPERHLAAALRELRARYGELVARTLPRALHLTAPQLGHGVSAQGCAPELIARFVRQADAPARQPFAGLEDGKDAGCLERLPAPPAFVPPAFVQPGLRAP